MIGEQCTIDIFFIDWECPKPAKGETVSVWRMYFVANEWNELQVTRKSSISLQIILTLLILKVHIWNTSHSNHFKTSGLMFYHRLSTLNALLWKLHQLTTCQTRDWLIIRSYDWLSARQHTYPSF